MAEDVDSLLLQHLERFQATSDDVREMKTRRNETHSAVIGLRRDQAHDAGVSAHLQVQFDALQDRLDRLDRRLDLTS